MQFKQKGGSVSRSPRAGVQPRLGRTGTRLSRWSTSLASASFTPPPSRSGFQGFVDRSAENLAASTSGTWPAATPEPPHSLGPTLQTPGVETLIGPASVRCSPLVQSTVARGVWSNRGNRVVPMVTIGQGQEGRRHNCLKKRGRGGVAQTIGGHVPYILGAP